MLDVFTQELRGPVIWRLIAADPLSLASIGIQAVHERRGLRLAGLKPRLEIGDKDEPRAQERQARWYEHARPWR